MGSLQNLRPALEHDRFDFRELDATSPTAFATLPEDVDRVVHLAAFKIPRYGRAIDTLTINYEGTRGALDFARRVDAKCVIASTSDIYGRNPTLPFAEATSDSVIGSSKSPRWAYAVSKLFDEHLGFAYQDAYGFPVTILRFFGSYGPRQHLSWWGGPQSVFIGAIQSGEPVTIHGDGSQTRTFTYVDDTIDGMYRAIVDTAADGEVFNVGGGDEISILELARLIARMMEDAPPLQIQYVPYESFTGKPYEDVMRRVPDTSLARERLGFVARIPLEEGLRRTIEWQTRIAR